MFKDQTSEFLVEIDLPLWIDNTLVFQTNRDPHDAFTYSDCSHLEALVENTKKSLPAAENNKHFDKLAQLRLISASNMCSKCCKVLKLSFNIPVSTDGTSNIKTRPTF
eukprot:NODE_41_length_29768_cov_0.533924.p20 type:complete len:108 gc:universal NODE_41_length_29768_cov_0.533924:25122-25445(+)